MPAAAPHATVAAPHAVTASRSFCHDDPPQGRWSTALGRIWGTAATKEIRQCRPATLDASAVSRSWYRNNPLQERWPTIQPNMKEPRFSNKRFSEICKLGISSPRLRRVAGGGTCQTFHLTDAESGPLFLKMRRDAPPDFFACETEGLTALARTGTVRVPDIVTWGKDFLLLEYIAPGRIDAGFWPACADALAALHDCTGPHFGFGRNNYCGSTPQPNPAYKNGHEFFAEARLGHQAMLAAERNLLTPQETAAVHRIGERLAEWIPEQPPSLVHGDLWEGNICCDSDGAPVLVDPAAHWGWGEADLAMTMLFSSPPRVFLERYLERRPLVPGWEERIPLYNLYHLLNHLNLFGGQWRENVLSVLSRFA